MATGTRRSRKQPTVKSKQRKKTTDKPSFFESPLWKRVEEHAKDWDNRGTAKRALKSMKPRKMQPVGKETDPIYLPEDKPARGLKRVEPMPRKPKEPMEPIGIEQDPDKPREKKKARKKKAKKPTSEFLEKYYGKDWA